jgi:hypothetical protein
MITAAAALKGAHRLLRHVRAGTVPGPDELADVAADWIDLLPELTDADFTAAVARWLTGDSPFWPTPGQLRACSPPAMLAATLGNDADTGRAWTDTVAAVVAVGRYRNAEDPQAVYANFDPWRREAIRQAIAETGGVVAILNATDESRPHLAREWRRAYAAARRQQAGDPKVVAAIATAAQRQIEGRQE